MKPMVALIISYSWKFDVLNQNILRTFCWLWTCFAPFYIVSVVDFEQFFIFWEAYRNMAFKALIFSNDLFIFLRKIRNKKQQKR